MALSDDRSLPVAKKQLLFRLLRSAEAKIVQYRNARNEMIMRHGQQVNATQWRIMTPGQQKAYDEAMAALNETPIEVPDIKFTELEMLATLSATEAVLLGDWLEVTPAAE